MTNNIVVLGSINLDIVLHAERLPKVGETMVGNGIDYLVGGKGSNQAVAVSRVGGNVSLLGKVGNDTFGEKILSYLKEENVDLSHLEIEDSFFTGIASIFKLPKDNCITVISGANELVDQEFVDSVIDVITNGDLLLVQLEIPISTVVYALRIAKEKGVITVLNPAPFNADIKQALDYVDYITPNEIEFEELYGSEFDSEEEFFKAMIDWDMHHTPTLIVTRGGQGVSFVEDGMVVTIPACPVNVVDTTGAGDTFNGILAMQLAKGIKLKEAIQFASAGASISTEHLGAQTGIPTQEKIKAFLNNI